MSRTSNFIRSVRALRKALWGTPVPKRARPCSHHFNVRETVPVSDGKGGHSAYVFVIECKNCGDIQSRKVGP